MRRPATARPARRSSVWLAAVVLGPPLVWLIDLQVQYWFAAYACDAGRSPAPLHAATAIALALVGTALVVAWLHPQSAEPRAERRSRFLVLCGVLLGAQFLLVIVAQGLAPVILGPCQ